MILISTVDVGGVFRADQEKGKVGTDYTTGQQSNSFFFIWFSIEGVEGLYSRPRRG